MSLHEAIHEADNNPRNVAGSNSVNERLRSIVERIERLNEERKNLSSDIKDIYMEAKSAGFDGKALRRLISDRSKDADAVLELESILEVYRAALG